MQAAHPVGAVLRNQRDAVIDPLRRGGPQFRKKGLLDPVLLPGGGNNGRARHRLGPCPLSGDRCGTAHAGVVSAFRISITIAAVQVKLLPPQGSAVTGS